MQEKPLTLSESFLVGDLRLERKEFLVVGRNDNGLLITSWVQT